MRGVKFNCGKTLLTGKDRVFYYVISNGITRVSWNEIHTPENIRTVTKVNQYGKAERVIMEYALDAIPEPKCRYRLLALVRSLVIPNATIEILFEPFNNSGPTYNNGVWRNNKSARSYLKEIERLYNVLSIHDHKITVKKNNVIR